MRLSGREAIEYAREHGTTLNKYADPTEDARDDLTPDEAEDVLREDPGLLYADTIPQVIHIVSGSNFHGGYSIRLRAPEAGGTLSERQARKVFDALCGSSECTCGGNLRYGDGPDRQSARVVGCITSGGSWGLDLVPAGDESYRDADAVIA